MMSIYALLTIMRIFSIRTPSSFVHEHIKYKPVFLKIKILEIVIKILAIKQTRRDEIVFDTFVLEILVYLHNLIQVFHFETNELKRLPAHVISNHKWSVKSIVAEKFELLSIKISCESFFFTFHVQDMQVQVSSRRLFNVFSICQRASLQRIKRGPVYAKTRTLISFFYHLWQISYVVSKYGNP